MKIPEKPIFEITITVHNLEFNHGDAPVINEPVLNEYGIVCRYLGDNKWVCENGEYDEEIAPPALWYSLPNFEITRTKLEKLSKEELIDMILKQKGE
jgi:hypothetical protein